MKTSLACCLSFALLAACTDGSEDLPPVDAPAADGRPALDAALPDAPIGAAATVVPCAGTQPVADIWYYEGIGFMGANPSIWVGNVIRFHDLGTHTADHAQGLFSFSGDADQCVKFEGPGTFAFGCYFHAQELGTITVMEY